MLDYNGQPAPEDRVGQVFCSERAAQRGLADLRAFCGWLDLDGARTVELNVEPVP